MAEGKVNLPNDLFSSKISEGHSTLKVDASGGHGEEKGIAVSLDDSKDQVSSDSSIPLSPQWLYSKPIDARTSITGAVGETRPPGSLPQGNSTDPILKDSWRLDGSQDKKDWRRTAPDVDITRRWREEERDTSLLGRRDRRKEDRRSEITSTSENRALLSSDRWHDSRGTGHDSRRENKWSSRWGPEDKEKDSRSEKRNEVEKEDGIIDKQSSVAGSRVGSERDTETRDKWRPRHRMEAQAVGVATYRAAPGFGQEKGRAEGSNMRFSPGRGRANINGTQQIGRPPLGSNNDSVLMDKNKAVLGKSNLGLDLYCYPRGKLLDIYRKRKVDPLFENVPAGMEHTPPMTQLEPVEPLAFIAPATEEEAILKDIWKGKVRSSEVAGNSPRGKDEGSNFDISGEGKQISPIGLQERAIIGTNDLNESDDMIGITLDVGGSSSNFVAESDISGEGKQKHIPRTDLHGRYESSANSTMESCVLSKNVAEKDAFESQQGAVSALLKHANWDGTESSAVSEISSNLPDDSHSLFEFSSLQQASSINQQDINTIEKARLLENVIPFEELSLCYLDPHGTLQGPFLGIDILLWLEQGFFATDLPVRLADAPEELPFQELGDIMYNFKVNSGLASGSNLVAQSEPSDAIERNPKGNAHTVDCDGSTLIDDQLWASTSGVGNQPQFPNQSYRSEIKFADDLGFKSFVASVEETALSKMAGSLMRPADFDTSYAHSTGKPIANEVHGSDTHGQEADKLHPFGLFMSELRDSSNLRHAQSSHMSSRLGDQGQFLDPLIERDAPFPGQSSLCGVAGQPSFRETLSEEYGINRHFNSSPRVGSLDEHHLSHMAPKHNIDVAEHLMLQKLQKERLQQQTSLSSHFPSHLTGSELEQFSGLSLAHSKVSNAQQMIQNKALELEHLLEIQLQQQRQLELQQQQEMEQQRQLELQQQQEMQHQQLLHQQMKLQQQQQQQQQSQALQLLLEQWVHQQIHDPNFGQSKFDLSRDNPFDQIQLRRRILHELQQNPHSLNYADPLMDQIIEANIGLYAAQGRQADLSELLLQARHGNMLPSEQQLHIQQEQLQSQQLSMALQQQIGLEAGRQFGRSWPINETGQLLRNSANHQLVHSVGFNASDIHKQQQRILPQEEQLNYLNRNFLEQNQRGFYEPSSMVFERSAPISSPSINFDSVNTSVQGRDLQERRRYMQPNDQPGSFSSHHSQATDDLYARHPDAFKRSFSGINGHLENTWTDTWMQQHQEAGRHRRELGITVTSADLNMPATAAAHEENSTRGLIDLLHMKLGLQSAHPSNTDQWHPLSNRRQDKPSSLMHPFELPPNQQIHPNDPFVERPRSANSNVLIHDHLIGTHTTEQYDNFGSNERVPFSSRSGSLMEEQSLLSANKDTLHPSYRNPLLIGKSVIEKESYESEANMGQRHEFTHMMSKSLSGLSDFSEQVESTMNSMELPADVHSRHSSLSSAGGDGVSHGREMGLNSSRADDVSSDRMPSNKGSDNAFHKRPPVLRVLSSPDVQSDQPSAASDGRRETSGNPSISNVSDAQSSGKKEARFRRTSSCSDGAVSDTSFIDMLKKPVHPEVDVTSGAAADPYDGGAQAGRGGKKKGKKGKQIDPSLLGFKVSSNRIMMGEIQRPED